MLKNYAAACLLATALTAAPAFAQSTPSTQDFVHNAAIGGMFEIQSSQLALKKSQDSDIRQVAQKLIDDHTKADDKLKSLAKNERVPTSLDQQHEQMLNQLQADNGSKFADDYKQMQISAHEQAISLFQSYGKNGSDPQLKQFAEQTVPTLQEHLKMAQQITIASNGNNTTTAQNGTNNGTSQEYLRDETQGTWRASKVIGLGVYNDQNQKVGSINEVLFGRDGKVEGVVIGVGGFLGLGERNVAVRYDELKWSMQPVNVAANNTPAGTSSPVDTNPAATGTSTGAGLGNAASPMAAPTSTMAPGSNGMANNGTVMASNTSNTNTAYPDHAILPNASKDQLQNAPQFNYGSAPR